MAAEQISCLTQELELNTPSLNGETRRSPTWWTKLIYAFRQLKQAFPQIKPSLEVQAVAIARVDRLIEYLFEQVLSLPNQEDQLRLLNHLLTSIAEEENLRFSHLLYAIDIDQETTKPITPPTSIQPQNLSVRDIHNPNLIVEKICRQSIAGAVNPPEQRRYQLELQQWLNLKQELVNLLPKQATTLLNQLDEELAKKQQQLLQATRFKLASPDQLIELAIHYPQLLNSDIWLGPRYSYFMPPSKVHPGGYSVVVVARPLYDATNTQFLLDQTQLLVKLNYNQLLALGAQLGLPPIPFTSDDNIKESYLLTEILPLPAELDHKSNPQLIKTLVDQVNPEFEPIFDQIDPKLINHYAQLLLTVVEQEVGELGLTSVANRETLNNAITPEVRTRLSHFIHSILFKGIKNLSFKLDHQFVDQIKAWYLVNRDQPLPQFEKLAAQQIGFLPALQKITSISQCVGLTPFSTIHKLATNSNLLNKITAGNLTQTELAGVIGQERARKWKMGHCAQCGALTLIGECGWCYACELQNQLQGNLIRAADETSNTDSGYNSGLIMGLLGMKFKAVGLGDFISGNDSSTVKQARTQAIQAYHDHPTRQNQLGVTG